MESIKIFFMMLLLSGLRQFALPGEAVNVKVITVQSVATATRLKFWWNNGKMKVKIK